jgi:hypothetical protein
MYPLSSKFVTNPLGKVDFKYVNVLVSRHSWKVITLGPFGASGHYFSGMSWYLYINLYWNTNRGYSTYRPKWVITNLWALRDGVRWPEGVSTPVDRSQPPWVQFLDWNFYCKMLRIIQKRNQHTLIHPTTFVINY